VLATTLAAPTLSLMAGTIYSTSSILFLPLLRPLSARTTLPMFSKLYHSGARLVVPIALAAAAVNAASAYFALDSTATNLFSTGSVLTLGTLAFTGTAMMGTNQRLLALNEQLGCSGARVRSSREGDYSAAAEMDEYELCERCHGPNWRTGSCAGFGHCCQRNYGL